VAAECRLAPDERFLGERSSGLGGRRDAISPVGSWRSPSRGNDSGTNLLDAADGASKRVAPRRGVLDVDRRTPYAAAVASPGEAVVLRP